MNLNYPEGTNTDKYTWPVHQNHSELVKFQESGDPVYSQVRQMLAELAEDAGDIVKKRLPAEVTG
jgi:hypothetical protein